jgi:hypothetical protein
LIDTIAMIGSPAWRGATASVTCAGRFGFAAASTVTVIAASAANDAISVGNLRLTVRVLMNRFAMLFPVKRSSVEHRIAILD